MKTKHEKRIDALRRREAQLLSECKHVTNNFKRYGSLPTDLTFYLREVNNVRRALDMHTLSISPTRELTITDGYTQFYPPEN